MTCSKPNDPQGPLRSAGTTCSGSREPGGEASFPGTALWSFSVSPPSFLVTGQPRAEATDLVSAPQHLSSPHGNKHRAIIISSALQHHFERPGQVPSCCPPHCSRKSTGQILLLLWPSGFAGGIKRPGEILSSWKGRPCARAGSGPSNWSKQKGPDPVSSCRASGPAGT